VQFAVFFLSVSSKSRPAYTMNDWFDVRFAIWK